MPIEIQSQAPLDTRASIELEKLEKNLSEEWLLAHLVPIITQTSRVSIRLMDWLVTNYSKEQKVLYTWTSGNIERIFDLHYEYKMTLDRYGRPFFDPFRRGNRVFFKVENDRYETTIGQLIFWVWAESHGVISYCSEHADIIETHMTTTHHTRDKRKNESKQRKRMSLSHAPEMKCFIFPMETKVTFNDK